MNAKYQNMNTFKLLREQKYKLLRELKKRQGKNCGKWGDRAG
jgi:hypothetical protein